MVSYSVIGFIFLHLTIVDFQLSVHAIQAGFFFKNAFPQIRCIPYILLRTFHLAVFSVSCHCLFISFFCKCRRKSSIVHIHLIHFPLTLFSFSSLHLIHCFTPSVFFIRLPHSWVYLIRFTCIIWQTFHRTLDRVFIIFQLLYHLTFIASPHSFLICWLICWFPCLGL